MNTRPPEIVGRSLFVGNQKLHLRGVTYGTFREANGCQFPAPDRVAIDFDMMAGCGVNAVRTYTVPPRWLLDLAAERDLWVMVGIPWEQHVAFLEDRSRSHDIVRRARQLVRECSGHPAVLCYAVGNEIPAAIVRWHGRRRITRFIERLHRAVKAEDPRALTTYVNYPSTEYLHLPFLDLVSFNVFLEDERHFSRYVARLQNLADERPLIVTEAGIDSRLAGRDEQARVLRWKIRESFAKGSAGVFVFAWTDEWNRGGNEIENWDFGLLDRRRWPKPSLAAVREGFSEIPVPVRSAPRASVVICTHNGASTLDRCLNAVSRLRYPDFETLVVDDGSGDDSAEIARRHGVYVLSTARQGLAAARNEGLAAASGEIVAYLDDDAYPDPDWLAYVAWSLADGEFAAIGGPNLPPPDEGRVASSVAAAPGGPVQVLIDDTEAEHIPGCNMAFRTDALREIGGFDPLFRAAGDDVDVCWRMQEAGHRVGFNAGAVVLHSRRASPLSYLRQQYGYGKAEAQLEFKWPSRYNRLGHLRWSGRIYGGSLLRRRGHRSRVGYGTWGSRLFQSVYEPAPGLLSSFPLLPEWYLAIIALALTAAFGLVWGSLLWVVPPLLLAGGMTLAHALHRGFQAHRYTSQLTRAERLRRKLLTSALFMAQPVVRLAARLRYGLSPWRRRPWRRRVRARREIPRRQTLEIWSETWRPLDARLSEIERILLLEGVVVSRGGVFDRWDLQLQTGLFGSLRIGTTIEEHGDGRQLLRVRMQPKISVLWVTVAVALCALAIVGFQDGAPAVGIVGTLMLLLVVASRLGQLNAVVGAAHRAAARHQLWIDREGEVLERRQAAVEQLDGRPLRRLSDEVEAVEGRQAAGRRGRPTGGDRRSGPWPPSGRAKPGAVPQ
ncbi:MAG: glycosyltransferase [bacterium]